jgi:hypothetical protein
MQVQWGLLASGTWATAVGGAGRALLSEHLLHIYVYIYIYIQQKEEAEQKAQTNLEQQRILHSTLVAFWALFAVF